jgi:hypothetical protein
LHLNQTIFVLADLSQFRALDKGLRHMFLQRLPPPEAIRRRAGPYFRAILHHPLQLHKSLGAEYPHYLHEQFLQGGLMPNPEVGKRVPTEFFGAGEPLVGGMVTAQPGNLSGQLHKHGEQAQ